MRVMDGTVALLIVNGISRFPVDIIVVTVIVGDDVTVTWRSAARSGRPVTLRSAARSGNPGGDGLIDDGAAGPCNDKACGVSNDRTSGP